MTRVRFARTRRVQRKPASGHSNKQAAFANSKMNYEMNERLDLGERTVSYTHLDVYKRQVCVCVL